MMKTVPETRRHTRKNKTKKIRPAFSLGMHEKAGLMVRYMRAGLWLNHLLRYGSFGGMYQEDICAGGE